MSPAWSGSPSGKKRARLLSYSRNRSRSSASVVVKPSSSRNPSRANLMAGCRIRAHSTSPLPYRSHAFHIPATVPGTLARTGPSAGRVAGRIELVSEACSGTRVRNSITTGSSMSWRYTSISPYPPTPLASGSTTPRANETATAASTTFPPTSRISTPAAVANECALDTAARPLASTRNGGRARSIS